MTAPWKAPDRIYLQPGMGDDGSATWCTDRINNDDPEYVRTDIMRVPPAASPPLNLDHARKVREQLLEQGSWQAMEGAAVVGLLLEHRIDSMSSRKVFGWWVGGAAGYFEGLPEKAEAARASGQAVMPLFTLG